MQEAPAMHSIWAVATNTIKQALRMKVALVFMILLLVIVPVLGFSATGDETLKGRLQTFLSYSVSLMSFLLCLLTIIISVYTVTSDIEQRQIYTVITKPIRRYQFLLGKLLGVVLLDVMLLALFSAIIYGITVYMPSKSRSDTMTSTEGASCRPTRRRKRSLPN
jgi:ABC-type transport system involved in multi-copper enzyme maturation permease subunit